MPELEQTQTEQDFGKEKENESMDERQANITNETQYMAIFYDGSERKEIFADTKEKLLQAVQEAKPDQKETDRCYIQEWDAESGKYKQEGIYLIESGRDITPIEFNMPYMSQETFDAVKQEIKDMGAKFDSDMRYWYVERSIGEDVIHQIQDCLEKHDEGVYLNLPKADTEEIFLAQIDELTKTVGGAHYNPDKKAWYITEDEDRSKFAAYLPSEKSSTIEPKNKDNHERA